MYHFVLMLMVMLINSPAHDIGGCLRPEAVNDE